MRDSCLSCARKHIAKAEVLTQEALLGYPEHAWLAIGEMAEAEAELLQRYPDLAEEIRECRLHFMDGLHYGLDENNNLAVVIENEFPTVPLIRILIIASIRDGDE